MAEELKELIEKIQEEGVKAAEDKARQVEAEAHMRARKIAAKAEEEAARALDEARREIARQEEGARASLAQASRDLMITLKKEMEKTLDGIISSGVHKALTTEELSKIILSLVKECGGKDKCDIVITLKKEDLEKLEKGFLSELKDEIKKGLVLKSSEDIRAGLVISYDNGKSHFDFTQKALAEYLSSCVKPKLAAILKGVSKIGNKT